MFILDANAQHELAHYLTEKQWLSPEDAIISLSKAGQGNMNYVLRVTTNQGSFIIKQSRGYVEKYPQIKAPEKRVLTEAAFYAKIGTVERIKKRMPELLGLDVSNNIMILEDLGQANDFNSLYDLNKVVSENEISVLVSYLNVLHQQFSKVKADDELDNLEMRKLNYEHIFNYPFLEDNGFDLDTIQEGLQTLAIQYKKDAFLKEKIELLGEFYMTKGHYLLHGDYYPGSWLQTTDGIKIIDPEFCYYGLREFDLGVFIAHLYLSNQSQNIIDKVKLDYYDFQDLDGSILNGFIGVEIMRRLIGLAQLPLQSNLNDKKRLLELAYKLITN
ncbi:5-methylthioribose kinase [Formosa agariphila KMM 3901]|uniref:5-methylthioribose kinase n=1 Tax=Formosa agariphila (strain DSM 15362 / KCTC 12365 / LMG 23005 / KMM 3901 / M-2Alg 35-1) TaxID=1347342 RepID=T2KI58_FORAG|nr:phosphotransferase [Formosa agariphila]CDF78108.1 5-methylthioribose kinase [Formosa agariphila KMM 3901]